MVAAEPAVECIIQPDGTQHSRTSQVKRADDFREVEMLNDLWRRDKAPWKVW